MDVKYINPFLKSIKNVFDMMLQVPFSLGKPHIKQDKVPRYEVSAIIGLSGTVTGTIVVSLSKDIALQLASALACEEITELNDDCTDALGEIANMIAGGAKKEFSGDNSISTPSIVLGRHQLAYPSGIPIISIPCETSAGRLIVDVGLKQIAVPIGV